MKKLLRGVIAAVLCCAMFTSCAGNPSVSGVGTSTEKTVLQPPFWVVEDTATGGTLYLLGSMHLGKSNTEYPDYIMDAYAACDTVAAELDVVEAMNDMAASMSAVQLIVCPTGTTAKDYFGEDYQRIADFCTKKGLPVAVMDYYIPYYWASNLSVIAGQEAGLDSDCGTETYFLKKAHADGKNIVEIESMDSQYQMMAEIPMQLQVQSVLECVGDDNFNIQVQGVLGLYEAWSTWDETVLESLNQDIYAGVTDENREAMETFAALMYLDRQQLMGEKAVEFLKSGEDVFMFVGAAHFYVEEDILTYLEDAGYKITAVRAEEEAAAAA